MSVLLRSQLECPGCHDIIASINTHDMAACKCGGTWIDGGIDYLRCGGDALALYMRDNDGLSGLTHAIFIAGPHSDASKAFALKVYKALWRASARGERPATTSEVYGEMPEGTRGSVVAYLKIFSDEDGCVDKVGSANGYRWLPKVHLVERSDAP